MSKRDINIYYQSKKLKTRFKSLTESGTNFHQKGNQNYLNNYNKNNYKIIQIINGKI